MMLTRNIKKYKSYRKNISVCFKTLIILLNNNKHYESLEAVKNYRKNY